MESEIHIEEEKILWKENPSHWTKLGYYIISVILIPVFGLGLIILLVVFLSLRGIFYLNLIIYWFRQEPHSYLLAID